MALLMYIVVKEDRDDNEAQSSSGLNIDSDEDAAFVCIGWQAEKAMTSTPLESASQRTESTDEDTAMSAAS